jgi:Na+-translocating ferredoxin:NAD+ oxidoreductase RnfC subunit
MTRFTNITTDELTAAIQNAGITGAGGAGFPTYAKWKHLDQVNCLLMNHQESEPGFYKDKWLGKTHAEAFADLFTSFLNEGLFDLIVVGGKITDRDTWLGPLADATNAAVRTPEDLPIDPAAESGVVIACTENRYQYGMESVLLKLVADVVIGTGLPTEYGWIVQNTETLWNVYRALDRGEPTTRTYVHVAGNVARHRFLDVPVGTPAADLLDAAGRPLGSLSDAEVLLHGGPGWSFRTDDTPAEFRVTKRTNGLLVLDTETVAANTYGDGRIDVLDARDWGGDHETTPTRLDPAAVGVPLVTNEAIGVVGPGEPVVDPGDEVAAGELIATPGDGISNAHHAPIDGTVTAVTDDRVDVRSDVCPVD